MSDPQREAELIVAGAQALVARSQALGLTWTRRLATVSDPHDAYRADVIIDGDTVSVGAFSMVGILFVGERVYVDLIPPGGIFIVGMATSGPTRADSYGAGYISQTLAVGTTTSATFVDLPGSPTASFFKLYDETRVLVTMDVSLFTSVAGITGVGFAALIDSTDNTCAQFFINTLAIHHQVSGAVIVSGVEAGTRNVVGRWRRYTGLGTLNVNADDWISIVAQEIP